ncbi:FAD/NAD(P)-binding domain-containing protein [Cylindrobasidium torrendii FP15055 ss-10]|uniref:FAD/NAD(P)-binding domain-containing protein n=1 Tax=Cylindrobasidium torrendii FP15055 ss-10 TaxID=1314674 RepID=A0A0D7AZI9_9AGAR|nr:FAD/NAD(P)-binding domain-containing protein [Cylindrobasidium torrendii FP15055 ss-10]
MVVSSRDNLDSTDKAFMPYDKLFHGGKGTFMQASVKAVEEHAVTLDNGKRLPFEALVVATGSKRVGPANFDVPAQNIPALVAERRASFAVAKNIVIAGGGAVGIELAAEIKDIWPEKEVTIVHSSDMLLNDAYSDNFRNRAADALKAFGIKLVLGDRINGELPKGATSVTTAKGEQLAADLVVPAWGIRPNTELLKSLPNATGPSGLVSVRKSLQLASYSHIFALGDIVDIPEQKTVLNAMNHANVVAPNVLSYLAGQPLRYQYEGSMTALLVTIGKQSGIGYVGKFGGITVGSWVVSMIKSKSLFISQTRKSMGL